MADRPVVVKRFGDYLRKHREARKLTGGQVEVMVSERFGLPLAHAVLWRYEAGKVASPDPAVLWALSRIYRVSIDEMIACLVTNRAQRPVAQADLSAPNITERSAGLSDDAILVAKDFNSLPEDFHVLVTTQIAALKAVAERYGHAMRFQPQHRKKR